MINTKNAYHWLNAEVESELVSFSDFFLMVPLLRSLKIAEINHAAQKSYWSKYS